MLCTDNLEIRRLRQDLILVYKLLVGLIHVNTEDLLTLGITLKVTAINCMYIMIVLISINIFGAYCVCVEQSTAAVLEFRNLGTSTLNADLIVV